MKNLIFERLLSSIELSNIKLIKDLSKLDLDKMSTEDYAACWLYNSKTDGTDAANEVIRLLVPTSENPEYATREWEKFELRKKLPEIFPNLGAKPRL